MINQKAFLCASIVAFAGAPAAGANAAEVVLGTDYFQTTSGTSFTFGGDNVPLIGDPIGPGHTDTIIRRTQDITIGGSSGPIQLTALSLESAAPISGLGAPIYVTLDPLHLANDTGTLTISGNASGGTFSSTLDVYFDICTAPGSDGVGCAAGATLIGEGNVALTSSDTAWSSTPPAAAVIVAGPLGDQDANVHTGFGAGQVDFFPDVTTHSGPGATHVVMTADVPETSSWLMLLAGFGGLGALAKRGRSEGARLAA